jgi:hypothetical protein
MKITVVALAMLVAAGSGFADEVADWNLVASNAMVAAPARSPLQQSRTYAMMHLSMHDALNAIDSRSETYSDAVEASPHASPAAAIAAAARDILVATIPGQQTAFEAQYIASLSAIPDGPSKTAGLLLGQSVAARMLASRASDGSDVVVPYTPTALPGYWQPTAPAFAAPASPGWGSVTPFGLRYGAQFRPEGPPALASEEYTRDYNEVKAIGNVGSTVRTAEQTEIARFHFESAGTEWNRIARSLVVNRSLDLWSSARMFAIMNMGIADGFIAGFDGKYTYNFWRPITAIRAGESDDNLDTVGDPTWTAFLATPAHPDYPSTHSTASAAAAAALGRFFGTDDISFAGTSISLPGVTRSFASFSSAAVEVSNSRVYAGIHFRAACDDGVNLGRKVGHFAAVHYLKVR